MAYNDVDVLVGKRKEDEQRAAAQAAAFNQAKRNTDFFGTPQGLGQAYLDNAFMAGDTYGRRMFVEDPQMQELLAKRKDLAQGYDGQTLGALRGLARGEIAGNQNQALAQLRSASARAGVGGARGAAMQGAARQNFSRQTADAERKMMLDQAGEIRKGTDDLEKFIFNQKYGQAGTAGGFAQLASADRAAQAQERAARGGKGNSWICTAIHEESPWTLGEMKTLAKLRAKASMDIPEEFGEYLIKGDKLVQNMKAMNADFKEIKQFVQEIIKTYKESPEKGVSMYRLMTLDFVNQYGVN
jgi:hypothetical protein